MLRIGQISGGSAEQNDREPLSGAGKGMTMSGIAEATGSAGEWGSRFRVGGSAANSKLGAPLILDDGNPVGIIIEY